MRRAFCWVIGMAVCGILRAETPIRHVLTPAPGMTRAELYVVSVSNVSAVLVLTPGCNGNGEAFAASPAWQAFAKERNLALVGVSFASELDDLHNGSGYYYAGNGSGRLLLAALDRLFVRNLPFLLYGFSGGAHFVSRFAEWKPERVAAWCAYSAGWWDEPKPSEVMPTGIVACGEEDERLGASLSYFKQGRAAGKPWLWIGVPGNEHSPDGRVEAFVRDYFSAVLGRMAEGGGKTGLWVDVETRAIADEKIRKIHPTGTGWLPDAGLFSAWQSLGKVSRQGAKTQSFETGVKVRTTP